MECWFRRYLGGKFLVRNHWTVTAFSFRVVWFIFMYENRDRMTQFIRNNDVVWYFKCVRNLIHLVCRFLIEYPLIMTLYLDWVELNFHNNGIWFSSIVSLRETFIPYSVVCEHILSSFTHLILHLDCVHPLRSTSLGFALKHVGGVWLTMSCFDIHNYCIIHRLRKEIKNFLICTYSNELTGLWTKWFWLNSGGLNFVLWNSGL